MKSQRARALATVLIALALMGGFGLRFSETAEATFINDFPVPWDSSFIPNDSVWDPTGNCAMVVGQDSAGQSNAWAYNHFNGSWTKVTTGTGEIGPRTFYVGSGAGNHSATVQGGVDLASNGDTVYVWPGTYAESVTVSKSINLTGHGRDTVIIDVGGISGDGITVQSSWVNISGVQVRNAQPSYVGIWFLTVSNCTVKMSNVSNCAFGIYSDISQRISILDNQLYGNNWGMYIYTSSQCKISDNQISDSSDTGIGLDMSSNNNIVSNNTIRNCGNGIMFEQNCYENTITKCTVTGSSNYGIYISESTVNTFTRNTLDNNYRGLWISDISSTGNQIFQNNLLLAYGNAAQWMARDPTGGQNSWHGGDPATGGKGGNYYLGYGGGDRGDGVGSVQFTIFDGTCIDMYPWMEPSGWVPYFVKVVDKNAVSTMVNTVTTGNQQNPAMAIGPDGSINMVWEDRRAGALSGYDIFFARSIDGGKTFSTNNIVNDNEGDPNDQINPDIAIGPSGTIYVVWEDMRVDIGDVYFSKSTDGGLTFTPNVRINSLTTNHQGSPSISLDALENIYVVWHSTYDIYFSKSTDGGSSFTANVRVDHALSDEQSYPSIAVDSSNNIYVAWQDFKSINYDIYFTKSTDGGASFVSPDVCVNDNTAIDQTRPRLKVDSSNRIHIVWQDQRNGNTEIYYSKSTNQGENWAANINLNKLAGSTNLNPAMSIDTSDTIYVAWQRSNNIYFSKSQDNGATFSPNYLFAREAGTQLNPAIATDSTGNLYGSWNNATYEVFCVRYTGNYTRIQSAIDAAPPTGTVRVMPGTYSEQLTINKPLSLIGEDRYNSIVDAGGVGYVVDITASDVTISSITLMNPSAANGRCVRAFSAGNIRVSDVSMYSPHTGVEILSDMGNNVVENCYISAMGGINFENAQTDNKILNCTLEWVGGGWGTGIYLYTTSNNLVYGNIIRNFVSHGIYIESSSNTFTRNTIQGNGYAAYLVSCSNNLFYHNNIIDTINFETVFSTSNNYFDNGYPSGGNYWSDYAGSDLMSGPGQDIPGSDGIGDTPYSNMEGTVTPDNYPWMQLNGWLLDNPTFPAIRGVVWDSVGDTFWLCGATGGDSSVYTVSSAGGFTNLVPLSGAPAYSFNAIAADHLGNVLVGGSNLDGLHYYNTSADAWHTIPDSAGSMAAWNITGITFNHNDNRFYIVGNETATEAVAFFTDIAPLGTGSKCYRDQSGFPESHGSLRSIEWNQDRNYALVVGDGVYRLNPYDGNPGFSLTWSSIASPHPDNAYLDISWDTDGWNEAAIVGSNQTFGNYWRYYHTNPQLIQGYKDPASGTKYRTCAFKPPSSPKWVLIPHAGGGIRINSEEKDQSGEITVNVNFPHIFTVDIWRQSDPGRNSVLNTQVEAGSTYTFFIEGNYTRDGSDYWGDLVIELTAWHDGGLLGGEGSAYPPEMDSRRTSQFNLSCNAGTGAANMLFPTPLAPATPEFSIHSSWLDSGSYGPDGSHRRLYINVTFGQQTTIAPGEGPMSAAATIHDPDQALNDRNSWDMRVLMYDSTGDSARNISYEEFGVQRYASISASGNPSGSIPPGGSEVLATPSLITYSSNTPYQLNVSIPNLYLNGDTGSAHFIPATYVSVMNEQGDDGALNSDIWDWTPFDGPDDAWCIWGLESGTYLAMPGHGTATAGPIYTDFTAAQMGQAYQPTPVRWQVVVPVGTPEGVYRGTITITLWS